MQVEKNKKNFGQSVERSRYEFDVENDYGAILRNKSFSVIIDSARVSI